MQGVEKGLLPVFPSQDRNDCLSPIMLSWLSRCYLEEAVEAVPRFTRLAQTF
jgi:hypothetical protein